MKARARWGQGARTDFETILLTRRELSRASARRLRSRILEAIEHLHDFPEMGATTDVPGPPGTYRRLVVDDYIVDYRHVSAEVLILSIRHGRMGGARS